MAKAARPTQAQQLAELQAENESLRLRLESLEATVRPPSLPAGVSTQPQMNTVYVGGKLVHLKPLPPVEFVKASAELPMFVVVMAITSGFGTANADGLRKKLEITAQDYERIYERAKGWLAVCAVEEVDVEALTVPEAENVLAVVCRMNGLTERVALLFHQLLTGGSQFAGHGLEAIRAEAERLSRIN